MTQTYLYLVLGVLRFGWSIEEVAAQLSHVLANLEKDTS